MKIRLFTLLATIFLLTNVTFGQSVGEYRVRKAEIITKKIEKPKKPKVIRENNPERKGYYVIPEAILGVAFERGPMLNVNATLGYDFNNHFALAVGIGLNNTFDTDAIKDTANFYDKDIKIPLYININGDFSRRPILGVITPYYDIDLGFVIPVRNGPRVWWLDESHEYDSKGLMFSPEFGVRVNQCYIGIKYMLTKYHRDTFIRGWLVDNHLSYFIESYRHSLSLKFGYKIPLNIGR